MRTALFLAAMAVTAVFGGLDPAAPAFAEVSSGDEREDERAASREMDFDTDMADSEMSGYIHGSVVGVNAGSRTITVQEEDDGDLFNFFVKDKATIEGVGSLREIEPGDGITVDYYDHKGRHVAENVDVEDLTPHEGSGKPPALQKVLSD